MKIRFFDTASDGHIVDEIILENKNGMKVSLLPIGATIRSIVLNGKDGKPRDVVIGFDTAALYEDNPVCVGVTVGRVANRIANARFTLNGKTYELTPWRTPGKPSWHSFPNCYSRRYWKFRLEQTSEGESVVFTLFSPDTDQGYPGNLTMTTRYTLTDENEVVIEYTAVSDQDTLWNPTNHSYFNLNGHDSGDVLSDRLLIASDRVPIYSDDACPTGEMRVIDGTPLDFRKEKTIGQDIEGDDPKVNVDHGFDVAYEINGGKRVKEPTFAASLTGAKSGIKMDVFSDLPSIQLYTPRNLRMENGKGGASYGVRQAVCLESGYFANAINTDTLEAPVLPANETRSIRTVYRFSVGA